MLYRQPINPHDPSLTPFARSMVTGTDGWEQYWNSELLANQYQTITMTLSVAMSKLYCPDFPMARANIVRVIETFVDVALMDRPFPILPPE